MKYLSINTVLQSFDGCRNKTQNKFWGMVSIIKAIGEKIIPATKYSFSVEKVQTYLEELFRLEDVKKTYSTSNMWSVVFSTHWIDFVPEQMFSSKPNIYDVAAWFYRRTALDDDTTPEQIVGSFMDLLNISIEDSKKWFSFQAVSYNFETQLYSESNLMNSILKKLSLSDSSNKTLSFEDQTFIKSNPGSLGQAPFVQTLYANQGLQKCLILTQFDFQDFYPVTNKTVSTINTMDNSQLQQIFYGAPGTGKSHTINEITEKQPEKNVFRTTFHPDSDYSTFVGCYKPSMKRPEKIYTEKELTAKLKEIKESGVTYPCHKFATKYWESLKDRDTQSIKNILSACGFTDSMAVEVSKGVAIGQDLLNTSNDGKIVYDFSPQTFTKAYLRAWQTEEPVFLVIEEINRGNCAQIFGDLFQLLDRRDDGYSEYPIKADNDLAAFIGEQLSKEARENIPENIKSGEILMLPSNLYIWATMNTSDQSLFPIDSAFKRRWEWKYIPIDTQKESWCINVNGTSYDWSDFLEKINAKIESATSSEDKMLGFYFCKAESGVISAEKFVNKVLFYLWNDVFKDYGFDDENNGKISFRRFYRADGKVDETIVKSFLDNLQVKDYKAASDALHEDNEEERKGGVPERQLRFWQGFNNARDTHTEYSQIYTERKALAQTWMDLSFGTSAYNPTMSVVFTKSVVRVGIWISPSEKSNSIYNHFKENEDAINELAGVRLNFIEPKTPDNKSYSITIEKRLPLDDESTWADAYDWMMSMAVKMKLIKDQFGA